MVRAMEERGLAVEMEEQVAQEEEGDCWEIRLKVRRVKERR